MNITVIGASRGSGAAVCTTLASRGHQVTAFSRTASSAGLGDDIVAIDGDVMDRDALAKATAGADAVVVTLGISDNPLGVRLLRRARTPLDVRSEGTRRVIDAMRATGVRRLVAQSTYGLGETRANISWQLKAFFALVIAPQIRDTEVQEQIVRASDLDWTLIRPVQLTDDTSATPPTVDAEDRIVGMTVSRRQVATAHADALTDSGTIGQALSVSSTS